MVAMKAMKAVTAMKKRAMKIPAMKAMKAPAEAMNALARTEAMEGAIKAARARTGAMTGAIKAARMKLSLAETVKVHKSVEPWMWDWAIKANKWDELRDAAVARYQTGRS